MALLDACHRGWALGCQEDLIYSQHVSLFLGLEAVSQDVSAQLLIQHHVCCHDPATAVIDAHLLEL